MRLKSNCEVCGKVLELVSETTIGETILKVYKCGHLQTSDKITVEDIDITSADGTKTARKYQEEGIKFIIESGFNCIIGDQMRLGKTPQALLALKNKFAERTPCLILVRSANLYQWLREFKSWTFEGNTGIFVIEGSKQWIPPGFSCYIMSMDTLSRGNRVEELLKFGFKCCIVDEAHSFKNTSSARSKALIQFLYEISKQEITHIIPFTCLNCKHQWEEEITINVTRETKSAGKSSYCPKCNAFNSLRMSKEQIEMERKCGAVLLTGTAIKNRANEYFVPLNIVNPERFPSQERFQREWLIQNSKGIYDRVHPRKMEAFKELIAPYVLRREKEDVYTDLPKINRMHTVIEIEDERIKDAYNKVLDKMSRSMEDRINYTFFDSIGDLSILRQLCGLAKVNWTADYLESSLLDSADKYAVGIHHHLVRDVLASKLGTENCLRLSGEDSAAKKDEIMRKFETSKEQILIVNMLAGGVGMDFHYCHNVLILERQWSSADEEQFEFRFYNPDKSIMGNHQTNIEYIIAKGTIDEWFYDLVESKRRIFGETISTQWSIDSDVDSYRMLLERTISNRL
jgi:SNF2 family DNA or RNA helicase